MKSIFEPDTSNDLADSPQKKSTKLSKWVDNIQHSQFQTEKIENPIHQKNQDLQYQSDFEEKQIESQNYS